ncbi:MAG: class I SAM-dependent methyltransferase [Anaerolineales bacterium]|jgi:predicted O-methyltransferase YrrM
MFHEIPQPVLNQMKALEEIDAKDRQDGTPHLEQLRQIPPETGKFLAILAANTPKGAWLEIGTSGGYSALWIAQAANLCGTKLITYELLPDKASLAKKTFKKAKVDELVEFVHGDARGHVKDYGEVAFCFLDAEREMFLEFYELIVPNLVSGGILAADNVVSHREELAEFITMAEEDATVDSVIVPIGKGLLVCRKL